MRRTGGFRLQVEKTTHVSVIKTQIHGTRSRCETTHLKSHRLMTCLIIGNQRLIEHTDCGGGDSSGCDSCGVKVHSTNLRHLRVSESNISS